MVDPSSRQIYTGRYELVRQIARGGMAEVYLAHDIKLDRHVALKILFPELSVDATFVERFRREAQAAANLSHPNIVSIFDWGEQVGTYFIVMEYVQGQALSGLIRGQGMVAPDRAAAIGVDVAAALGFAHRNGVIHRDVKPGNVLLTREGSVKVTDFGIARAANNAENLTQTGAVMGTATYFSPEQAQGLTVDPRSDIYSLGIVLYEMVTGRPPFVGDGPMAVAYKHVNQAVPDPRHANPAISADFQAVIMQCLAKDPAGRYSSADELRADLLRFRQGQPVRAVMPFAAATTAVGAGRGASTQSTTVLSPTAMPASYDAPWPVGEAAAEGPPTDSNTWLYGLLLGILLIALGVVLFLLARSLGVVGSGSASPTTPTTLPAAAPTTPATSAPAPAPVSVTNVIGLPYDRAGRALQAAGFNLAQPKLQPSNTAAYGIVLNQDPLPDTPAQKGDTVTLTVSSGKGQVSVPDVTNRPSGEADDTIGKAGFKFKNVHEASASVASGAVTRTDPPANTPTSPDATVTVFVSNGPAATIVPEVANLSQGDATAILVSQGFTPNVVPVRVRRSSQDGIVRSQDPEPNATVAPGSTVTISVGKFGRPG